MLVPWKESYDKPRQYTKKQRHHFVNKGPHSQSYGFSSSHVWMWEFDHKEGWVLQNWWFWNVVLGKTLGSPLKEIRQVNLKENQPWIFIGRTVAESEAPTIWPHDAKRSMMGKIEGKWSGQQNMTWLDSITNSMDMNLSKLCQIDSELAHRYHLR